MVDSCSVMFSRDVNTSMGCSIAYSPPKQTCSMRRTLKDLRNLQPDAGEAGEEIICRTLEFPLEIIHINYTHY